MSEFTLGLGGGGNCFFFNCNLGQEQEAINPLPPKAMMKARRSKILASLKWGRGGPDVPFIVSKIVVVNNQMLINKSFHNMTFELFLT